MIKKNKKEYKTKAKEIIESIEHRCSWLGVIAFLENIIEKDYLSYHEYLIISNSKDKNDIYLYLEEWKRED